MASVNWQKANVQTIGAMSKHNGKEEREKLNHSNTDIDKSKSYQNIYIGADDWAQMADKVSGRITEVDRDHPPIKVTKDRVTAFLLYVPVPLEIEKQGRAAEFLQKSYDTICSFFGSENVGGLVGHFDEKHNYINKDGEEIESLIHGHVPVAAYCEWTEDVTKNVKQENGKYKKVKTGEKRERCGINGKNCSSKQRLQELNRLMDKMCIDFFGVSYNTGEHIKGKTVEELKKESQIAELNKEHDELSNDNDELTFENIELTRNNTILGIENSDLKVENEKLQRDMQAERKKFKEERRQLDKQWDTLRVGFDELDEEKASADDRERALNERETALQAREHTLEVREGIISATAQNSAESEHRQRIVAIRQRAKPISSKRAEWFQRAEQKATERKQAYEDRINQRKQYSRRKTAAKDEHSER